MIIAIEKLSSAIPTAKKSDIEKYHEHLVSTMQLYEINTKSRIAMFLANIAHESQSLSRVVENLNYSAERLRAVFPKYFRNVNPAGYHRQPQKIANYVYANRMGNGPVTSGDGWRFRGRGLIQITGRSNYTQCGIDLKLDLIKNPEYLETPHGATISAGWFWNKTGLNKIADSGNIREATRRINGGFNGLDDRIKRYNHILRVL